MCWYGKYENQMDRVTHEKVLRHVKETRSIIRAIQIHKRQKDGTHIKFVTNMDGVTHKRCS